MYLSSIDERKMFWLAFRIINYWRNLENELIPLNPSLRSFGRYKGKPILNTIYITINSTNVTTMLKYIALSFDKPRDSITCGNENAIPAMLEKINTIEP